MYQEGNEEEAVAAAEGSMTTLEAVFCANQVSRDERNGAEPDPNDASDCRKYFYPEMPLGFVFTSNSGWKPRRKCLVKHSEECSSCRRRITKGIT